MSFPAGLRVTPMSCSISRRCARYAAHLRIAMKWAGRCQAACSSASRRIAQAGACQVLVRYRKRRCGVRDRARRCLRVRPDGRLARELDAWLRRERSARLQRRLVTPAHAQESRPNRLPVNGGLPGIHDAAQPVEQALLARETPCGDYW